MIVEDVLRPLPGGSQSLLARSFEDRLIVKCPYNPQGPNVLANEFIAIQLLSAMDIPTPRWHLAEFRFQRQCPQCARQTLLPGNRPLHFASVMMPSDEGVQVYQKLPRSHFSRIRNRADFLKVFIFDIWAGSTDQRQALFITNDSGASYQAFFIDHGHLFGGPKWNSVPSRGIALNWDNAMYQGIITVAGIEEAIDQMLDVIPNVLPKVLAALPIEWQSAGAFRLGEDLLTRLCTLRRQIIKEIGSTFLISAHHSDSLVCA